MRVVLRLRDEDERGLVLVLREMPVHAVVARVEPAAHEPLPERRVGGVQRGVPVLIPGKQIGVLPEALRKAVEAEAFHDPRVGEVGLADKFCGGLIGAFLFPVDGDLRLADRHRLRLFPGPGHCGHPPWCATPSPEVWSTCASILVPYRFPGKRGPSCAGRGRHPPGGRLRRPGGRSRRAAVRRASLLWAAAVALPSRPTAQWRFRRQSVSSAFRSRDPHRVG